MYIQTLAVLSFVLFSPLLFSFFVLGQPFKIVQTLALKHVYGPQIHTRSDCRNYYSLHQHHYSSQCWCFWSRPTPFSLSSVHLMSLLLRLGGLQAHIYMWRGTVPPPDISREEGLRIGLQSQGCFICPIFLVALGVAFGSTLPVNRP